MRRPARRRRSRKLRQLPVEGVRELLSPAALPMPAPVGAGAKPD